MQLTLHVTKACNLRCTYCYYRDFPTGRMTAETALAATGIALDRTAPGDALAVTFFGGEPLMAADLIRELVPRIRHRALRRGRPATFKVPTNGHLLDDDLLAWFEANGVFVSLSIDGDAAGNRGRIDTEGRDGFAPTLAALRRLVADATAFATYSVITPGNVAHLADGIRFLHGEGARILVTALDHGADWSRRDLRILGRQYRALAAFYREEMQAGRPLFLSAFDGKIEAHTRPTGDGVGCAAGVTQISVAPDGTLYPCVQFVEDPRTAIGHVMHGIDESCVSSDVSSGVPSGATVGAMSDAMPHGRDEPCDDCGIRSRCGRDCACVRFQAEGDTARLSALVCAHERLLIPIADRLARELYRRRTPLFVQTHYNPAYNRLRALEALVRSMAADPSTPGAHR